MATINQLVRKPRVKSVPKNKVPALEACWKLAHRSVVYVLAFTPPSLRSLIRLCVRFAVCV